MDYAVPLNPLEPGFVSLFLWSYRAAKSLLSLERWTRNSLSALQMSLGDMASRCFTTLRFTAKQEIFSFPSTVLKRCVMMCVSKSTAPRKNVQRSNKAAYPAHPSSLGKLSHVSEHFIPISDPGRTLPFWILQGSWWPWCIEPPNIPPELRRWSHLSRAKWSLQPSTSALRTSHGPMYCPRISDSRVSTAPEGNAFLAWTRSKRWARWAQSAQGLAWTSKENNGKRVVRNVVENVC